MNTIVTDMKKSEEDMTKKESEIEKAEEELVNAKVDEQNQYESMKKRIKYIYENGSSEFLEIMLEAKDMADFLNKAEYATKRYVEKIPEACKESGGRRGKVK